MTVPAGYYDESYPPSVLNPGPTSLRVQADTGWLAGNAVTGVAVTILVWDEEVAITAPTQVDWGDGSRNTSLTHIYVTANAGPLHIVVTADGKQGTSAAFAVVDPSVGTTGQPPDEPCPDEQPELPFEPEPKKAAKK